MSNKVEVNTRGIKNRLKTIRPHRSIAEYIWNGYDAGATEVSITYEKDDIDNITKFEIQDNGDGIPYEDLEKKFKPVLSSEKQKDDVQYTLLHGKNGLGRLTFYHYCQKVKWLTTYKKGTKFYQYEITVHRDQLSHYDSSKPVCVDEAKQTGTIATFYNFTGISANDIDTTVKSYLVKEFGWLTGFDDNASFSIIINGEELLFNEIIEDTDTFHKIFEQYEFQVSYVRWKKKLNNHYSRFYCINALGELRYSKPTTFNNKGDDFYHTIYIHSAFFNKFKPVHEPKSSQEEMYEKLNTLSSNIFKMIMESVNEFLSNKRKPFLVEYSKSLVDSYEKEGILSSVEPSNAWEKLKAEQLSETVKQLYQVEPRIFTHLNIPQKKTFVGLLSLLMDSGEFESVYDILEGVVELSPEERRKLAKQLKITQLSSIIKTIELISDRFRAVQHLKTLVFDPKVYANEVDHLQKHFEKNYWLIGEQYQLLTAAEPDFEEALRRHAYLLRGETQKQHIDHPDKKKEMDIFIARQDKRNNIIENVVVELKHPLVLLGKKEIDQVHTYYNVIRNVPQFNASNMSWKFYLIGNRFDSTEYITDQINSLKHHGQFGLVHKGKFNVYALKWSEIISEFELRHEFLNEKLKLERNRIATDEHYSAEDIINESLSSDQQPELVAET